MQVDFFDIERKTEPQEMVMPWPMKICNMNLRGDKIRIYYVLLPRATEQVGTFYCVTSEQVLPATFAATLIGTVFGKRMRKEELAGIDYAGDDDAVHVFFETPVNAPKKPHPVKKNGGADSGTD